MWGIWPCRRTRIFSYPHVIKDLIQNLARVWHTFFARKKKRTGQKNSRDLPYFVYELPKAIETFFPLQYKTRISTFQEYFPGSLLWISLGSKVKLTSWIYFFAAIQTAVFEWELHIQRSFEEPCFLLFLTSVTKDDPFQGCWNRSRSWKFKTERRGMHFIFLRLFFIDKKKIFQMRKEREDMAKNFKSLFHVLNRLS